MKIAAALSLLVVTPIPWYADWTCGLPLIVLTLVIHVLGLLFIDEKVARVKNDVVERYGYRVVFVVIIGATAMSIALMHGIEAVLWAVIYWIFGALPDYPDAVLYSLSAMTSYGHANIVLEKRWQLLGALESLNGMLLFGVTTAFLFGIIQRANLGDVTTGIGFFTHGGHFTSFEVPGSAPKTTGPHGINDNMQVVGFYTDGTNPDLTHGFLLEDGKFTTIDFPKATVTAVFGIDEHGEMVGSCNCIDGSGHSFMFANGKFTVITYPVANSVTKARGINDRQQIVAWKV